ncbi:hypothetical protein TanjilG_26496 [Lupinus angustifolius]|uniref:Transmembrane protein n=1 Tax=Lupinus angustifolius TaxID=3871 RepID=A0A394DCK9_LUPAN|nr:PREDICTED: uncharacterized protein LOC109339102 [Lupinus angustifolius]OIW20955.1 hypothetical protein TanjilG_26496 [Lupinus angustifolius]
MASFRLPLFTATVLLFLSATATARPCRSFFMSSYTFRNPSSNTFTTITEFRSFTPLHRITADNDNVNDKLSIQIIDNDFIDSLFQQRHHHHPFHNNNNLKFDRSASLSRSELGFSTTSNYASFDSLRNRTKDIISVVVALLFGVGCGALTSATMYLVWSVVSGFRDYRGSGYDSFSSSDDENEIETPKKLGYEKIPAAEAVAPPAAKDVV